MPKRGGIGADQARGGFNKRRLEFELFPIFRLDGGCGTPDLLGLGVDDFHEQATSARELSPAIRRGFLHELF